MLDVIPLQIEENIEPAMKIRDVMV